MLFAGGADRAALAALFHLNLELARIADHANEPMAGYIRLQWWRDAVAASAAGSPPSHPVVDLMAAARLAERLGADQLLAMVDARERELDATPMARVADVERHARATAGALNAAVAAIADGDTAAADAAAAIGTAYGLLGIVRAVPFVLGRSQPLLPETLLQAAGTTAEALRSTDEREALVPVLRELAGRARALLDAVPARQPRRLSAAFVPALLARQDLKRLDSRGFDVFDGRLTERPPWTVARCLGAVAMGWFR